MLRDLWEWIWIYVPRFQTWRVCVDIRTFEDVDFEEYLKLPQDCRGIYKVKFFNLFGYPICYRSSEIITIFH